MALGIGPGDEVISTPVHVRRDSEVDPAGRATPVYCDIGPQTYNLDPAKLERAITPKTPRDHAGQPVRAVRKLRCDQRDRSGLQAAGDRGRRAEPRRDLRGKQSGSLTRIAGTSFYPFQAAWRLRRRRAPASPATTSSRASCESCAFTASPPPTSTRASASTPRLDSIQCAILLAKMEIFPDEVERRGEIAQRYDRC